MILVVTLTPIGSIAPIPTGDNSWHAALAMAFHQNIQFGPAAIFTYGPLGFLEFPQLYFTSTFILAELYVVASPSSSFLLRSYWSPVSLFRQGMGRRSGGIAGTWGVAAALFGDPTGSYSACFSGSHFRRRSRPDLGGCALARDELSETCKPGSCRSSSAPVRHSFFLVETNMSVLVGVPLGNRSGSWPTAPELFRLFDFRRQRCGLFSVSSGSVDGQWVANVRELPPADRNRSLPDTRLQ